MGQAQSDAGQEPVEPYFGVMIAPELLEQLDRVQRKKPTEHRPAATTRSPLLMGGRPAGIASDIDLALQLALTDSTRAGDMLLKYEDSEAQKVAQQAEDLMDKHYRVPKRHVPCSLERSECIKCYALNADDPLRCSAEVAAFSACANNIQRSFAANSC